MTTLNLHRLWIRRWWIVLSSLASLGFAAGYLQVTDPVFEVESRVLIENRGFAATDSSEKASRYREFLSTQGEILGSERVVAPAIHATEAWATVPTDERLGFVKETLKDFEVATVVNTDVIRLRYRGKDADFAVQLLDGVLDEYAEYIRTTDRLRHGSTLQVLEHSERELSEELVRKGRLLAECRSKNGLVGSGRDMVNVELSSLNNIAARLSETRSARLDLQIKLGSLKTKGASAEGIAFVSHEVRLSDSTFPQLRTVGSNEPTEARGAYDVVREQWEAKAAFDEVSTKFGPKHPEYQAAKERVEEWSNFTDQHNSSLIKMLENELAAAVEAEYELQALVDEERSRIKKLDKELLEEQHLTSEIARIEAAHAISLERLRDYRITDEHIEQGELSTSVVMLSKPAKPDEPIWPKPIPFLAICGMFGAALSSIAALYL